MQTNEVDVARADSRTALLIILTFNSYDLLSNVVDCIQDFLASHAGNHAIVIENSSDRRVYDFIRSHLDSSKLHVEVAQRNEGFSPGVNYGYTLARELWGDFEFFVLLNPDVISAGRLSAELVDRAARPCEAEVGIWGAVLKDETGRIDNGCARRVWNRRRFFTALVGHLDSARLLRTAPLGLTLDEIETDQRELALVSGGMMCIRADVFDGGLDTQLPLYLEDQEICHRSLRKGYTTRLYPDLQAVHLGGVSRKSTPEYERALRIMELVESPVQCMFRYQGHTLTSLRLTVFFGGAVRFAAITFASTFRLIFRNSELHNELAWAAKQSRLALWFVSWAIKGRFHREPVSLAAYLEEYTAVGTKRRRRHRSVEIGTA